MHHTSFILFLDYWITSGHCESAYTNLKAGTQFILWEETPDTHQTEQFIKL